MLLTNGKMYKNTKEIGTFGFSTRTGTYCYKLKGEEITVYLKNYSLGFYQEAKDHIERKYECIIK